MRSSLLLIMLAFAAGLVVSVNSWAACGLSFTPGNISESWDLNYTYKAVQFTISKTGPDACNFWASVSPGGAGPSNYLGRRALSGSNRLYYQLYKDNALTQVLKDPYNIASTNDVISGGFQAGSNMQQTVIYYFAIPYSSATSPTLVAGGTYTDSFLITLYEGSNPTANPITDPLVSAQSVSLTVTVPVMIRMSIVDPGGAFDINKLSRSIDFGTFVQGQVSTFDIRVRTNAGYDVTFSSANNGQMKSSVIGSSAAVPYSLYANNILLDMSNSASVPVLGLQGSGQSGLDGLGYPMRVVIGGVSAMQLSGSYADQIIVTATTTQ